MRRPDVDFWTAVLFGLAIMAPLYAVVLWIIIGVEK